MKDQLKKKFYTLNIYLFVSILVLYVLMLLAEAYRAGFVSNHFNFHILLYGVVLTGILYLKRKLKPSTKNKITTLNRTFFPLILITAIALFILNKFLTRIRILNFEYLWLVVLLSGILYVLTTKEKKDAKSSMAIIVYMFILATIAAFFSFERFTGLKTPLRLGISIAFGILFIIAAMMVGE